MRKLHLLLFLVNFFVYAKGQVGNLDPAFGNKGIQTTAFSQKNRLSEDGREVLYMENGNLLVVFQVYNSSTFTTVTILSRYLPDGTIDPSYGSGGYSVPVGISGAKAVKQGDKIIVAGSAHSDFALARYKSDGSLDSTFGAHGFVTTDFNGSDDVAQSLAIQNGNIIIAGSTSYPGSFNSNFGVARYTANGFLDSTFGEQGIVITDFAGRDDMLQSVVIQDNKVVVAGTTVVTDSLGIFRDDFAVARYNSNGSPDLSFGNNGLVTTDFNGGKDNAQAAAIQGDKIIIAGYTFDNNTATVDFALARYNLNGSLDSSFNGNGIVTTGFVGSRENYAYSIGLQEDKIVITGQTVGSDSLGYLLDGFALARYNSSGSLDSTFGNDGLLTTNVGFFEAAHSIAIQNNKIAIAGTTYNGSDDDFAIVQYNSNGTLDSTFNGEGLVVSYYPSGETYFTSVAMQRDKIVAAGDINNNISSSSFAIARYNPDGSLDSTFNKNGLVTKDFGEYSGIARSIAIQGDKIVIAGYTYPFSNFILVRYNSDGSPDSSFGVNGVVTTDFSGSDDIAQSVVIQGNKIIVAGSSYNSNNFNNDFAIARYNQNGSPDSSFNGNGRVTTDFAGLDDNAQSLVVQNDKIVVVGSTRDLFSSYIFALARYNSDGSLDPTFGVNGLVTTGFGGSGNFAQSVAIQGNKIVVAGYTSNTGSVTDGFAVARYNLDGSLDATFNKNGLVITDVGVGDEGRSVVTQGDKIIVGGITLDPVAFANNFAIVRYNTDGSLDSTFSQDGVQITGKSDNSYSLQQIVLHENRLYAAGSIQSSGINTFGAVAAYQLQKNLVLLCPGDTSSVTDKGRCSAIVRSIDPVLTSVGNNASVTYTLAGATTGSGVGSASGKTFNKGATTVTYSLTNDATKTCSFTVTVQDKERPVITRAIAVPLLLWPPDHKMRLVNIDYSLADNCGATASLSVTSSEPQSGTGPGDLSPDWEIVDAHHVRLRAESSGFRFGSFFPYIGRIYTILIEAKDAAGNTSTKRVWVLVPPARLYDYANGKEDAGGLEVSVMPNPSSSYFTLLLNGSLDKPFNLRVSNELGRVIETKTGMANHGTLRLGENYPTGVYFAEISQGYRRVVVKLIKLYR